MRTKRAFTIIEISLTLGFISVLLITIALLIVNITSTYQKGLAIRAVNTTGEELVDDFSHAISSSASKNVLASCNGNDSCKEKGGLLYVYHQFSGNYDLKTFGSNTTTTKEVPMHGVFCTGRYSYVYRTGYLINANRAGSGSTVTLKYKNTSGTEQTVSDFRVLKVQDTTRTLCSQFTNSSNYTEVAPTNTAVTYDKTDADINAPVELLDSSDDDLAIYDLVIFPPVMNTKTKQNFISGTFILATVAGGINITGSGDYCTDPPDNLATDFNYCAINKFNFAMRATGQLTKEERNYDQNN